jgi:hypothetical protein
VLKNIWNALLRIVGEYKSPEIKFFWFILVLQFALQLLPDKPNSEFIKLPFGLAVLLLSISFVLFLLISDKDVENDNLTLIRLLSTYKDPELLQLGKTSVSKKWRLTSLLLIAPWASILTSSKILGGHKNVFGVWVDYFYYFSIVGILASITYFLINHLRVLRFET